MKKKLPNDIKKKVEEWKFDSGALVLCLVAYPEGRMFGHSSLYIFLSLSFISHRLLSIQSTPIVRNSFTNSYNNWKEGTYENFKEWAVKQFRIKELESDDEAEVPVLNQKAKNISFQKNK